MIVVTVTVPQTYLHPEIYTVAYDESTVGWTAPTMSHMSNIVNFKYFINIQLGPYIFGH